MSASKGQIRSLADHCARVRHSGPLGWRLAFGAHRCFVHGLSGGHRAVARIHENLFAGGRGGAVLRALRLWLGVWVTRSKRAARIITPIFDLMQATPHLAYLVPVVVMFGAGQVPALIATVIFAMPPMARCTILAIQTVPSDITESGRMSGCTPRQLLWKVQLPASQRTLLLGLNQVIMQTLAMVVICSLVGAQGLGHKLLFSLQQLKLGFATMQGAAIVLMAIVLDRITQAYANRAVGLQPSGSQNLRPKARPRADLLWHDGRDDPGVLLHSRCLHAVQEKPPGGQQGRIGTRQGDQDLHLRDD